MVQHATGSGPDAPATAPETNTDPFLMKNDQLYLLAGDGGYNLIQGSPRDTRIGAHALSPDGKAFAYGASRPGGIWVYTFFTRRVN